MLRRAPYYFLIVAAVVFIWVKGATYVHEARLGLAATPGGFFSLAKLVVIFAAGCLAIYVLVQGGLSGGSGGVAESGEKFHVSSFVGALRRLQALARRAFARRPVLASILSVVLAIVFASIPVGLVALGRAGGVRAFGVGEWTCLVSQSYPWYA
jgi:hypothetical protein